MGCRDKFNKQSVFSMARVRKPIIFTNMRMVGVCHSEESVRMPTVKVILLKFRQLNGSILPEMLTNTLELIFPFPHKCQKFSHFSIFLVFLCALYFFLFYSLNTVMNAIKWLVSLNQIATFNKFVSDGIFFGSIAWVVGKLVGRALLDSFSHINIHK